MKKLFVSVPMKGRTEEDVKNSVIKMHTIAEAYYGEPLELINSYVDEEAPKNCNAGIWYLSKSLLKLAEADVFIGIADHYSWHGCHIEREVANNYGIKCYGVDPEIVIDNYESLCNSVFAQPHSVMPL